jgi:hypothetical protein
MIKSTAIDLLKSFSKRELKELTLFLKSPFHNTDQSVVRLFSYIKKYYPVFEHKDLTKEEIFEEVYRGKKYNEQTLKSVFFNLAGCIKEYLVLHRIYGDPVKKNLLLADELLERENLKLLGKVTGIAEGIEISKGIHKEGFYSLHYADYLKWQAASFTYDHTALIRNFVNKSNHFLIYMIMELMYDVNAMDTFKFNHNTDFGALPVSKFLGNFDLKSFLNDLNRGGYKYSYILEMSLSITMFLAGNYDEKLYIKASSIFKKNIQAFEQNEIYGISTMLINMCRKFEKTDEEKYTREKFEIYKLQLKKNAYRSYPNAPLTVDKFRNIVNAALYLKELKWTERFISDFKEMLPENIRDDVTALAIAYLYAEKGEYESALEITAKVKVEYFAYKPDLKLLQLRCFYELGYTEEAFSSADALRHFMKSQSLSSSKQSTIQIFLNYYLRLLKLRISHDKHTALILLKDVNNNHTLSSKNWFLRKIAELE